MTVNRLKFAQVSVLNLIFHIVKVLPTPLDKFIFSHDEHDNGGTNNIENNILGDTFDEEQSKKVELEESIPESGRAPSVLDVETEGKTHSSDEENTDDKNGNYVEELKVPDNRTKKLVNCARGVLSLPIQEPPINCVIVATMLGLPTSSKNLFA